MAASQQVEPRLGAETFAAYCREADVGEAYQQHLRDVFELSDSDDGQSVSSAYNPAVGDIGRCKSMDMQIDLHIAFAKANISEHAYAALLKVLKADLPAAELKGLSFQGKPLIWQALSIHDACVWGVLIFSHGAAEGFPAGPLLVYMPNEPTRPWFEYPTIEDFKTYLTLKLQVPAYCSFFARYLDESERLEFLQHFDKNKTLERVAPMSVLASPSGFFFSALTRRIQLDAQVLAVPTAEVDEEARRKRLQAYLEAGLTLLNLAGLVVPVFGQLMMGVAVGEMLGEMFEAVEDWSHGEQSQALEHVLNVVENIAGMVLFAAGVKTVSQVIKATKIAPAAFFDKVEAIRHPGDTPRLWRRRLGAYRQLWEIDAHAIANSQGIYQANGQSYIKVDGALYSITYDARLGHWRARHALRNTAYRPPLRHNGQGGWQFTFERADQWFDERHLLVRLDPGLLSIPEDQLRGIASITGLTLPRLRTLARESMPLPERFRDGVVRLRQNQKVRDLAWQLEHQPRPDANTALAQLRALPLLEGWPKGRFFEVLDNHGNLLERYPDTSPFDYEDLSIHITEQQVEDGEVMPTLLAALDPEEAETLLGGEVEAGERQATLTRKLLASLKRTHRQVYEQLYVSADEPAHSAYDLLKSRYPRLPNRMVRDLLFKMSLRHRRQMRDTRRVPLLLAQHARETLETFEEDHALLGLLLPELATEDTTRMATGLLARLPGWPRELALQVRAETFNGRLMGEVGNQSATMKRTLVKSAQGVQAFDEQGKALASVAEGHEGLYQAMLDALSAEQRGVLRMSGPSARSHLRDSLWAQAQAQRGKISRYLRPEHTAPESEPEPLCVAQALVNVQQHPKPLVAKVRKLYPLFDELQITAFLDEQGTDHLSRARAVQALEREFDALHRALKVWQRDNNSLRGLPYPVEDYRVSRYYVRHRIENAWRRMILAPDQQGVRVPTLDLDGMVMGPLPTLPNTVNFGHIRQLSLNHLELSDDVGYFLKHFKGLETLELQDNRISRLPEALSLMPDLKRLYLDDNRLQLTEYTRAKLAGMTDLQVLNLSNNPLLDPPALDRMFSLRELFLRNCRLTDLPVALRKLPYLDYLDLRDNEIAALPKWLFDLPRNAARPLNLRQNPLDGPSRQLLSNYRRRTGIGMGFLEDDIARLNEQKARELWLDSSRTDYAARKIAWNGLKDESGSDGLFQLLSELGGTADASQVHEDLSQRVWRVLSAAEADAQLRAEIFERAATPLNCDDAAAVSFANLEVLTEVHKAAKGVEGGVLTAKPLLRLGKGLFRLDQLERYAQTHIAGHPSVDPLEVSLAFRTGLADRFYLPGQPKHMRFARLGGVTSEVIASAAGQLQTAELSPALLKYLIELPLWNGYLKKTFNRQFERLNQPFEQRMQEVFDQVLTLDDADYRVQMEQVLSEQAQAEKARLESLTEDALKIDRLNVCRAPLL
ncbi:NEL-type E3 ubiquitin ligase domain-containing protein [Pseudomonas trivialis]|uniref:NEL-type E3 ubiquitin ligase domain-containing protein n=1 Tax=Pseudomonas trivialis TaxID=200450 RepID=UPI0030D04F7A